MKQRYVFLHYHIFKNGGSTIDWILEKNFDRGFATIHEPVDRGIIGNDEIVDFLERNPEVVALSSHHFQLPFPTHPTLRFLEIGLLRHPLDRLQSMYHYYRRIRNPQVAGSVKAQELDLPAWLEWLMEAEPFNTFDLQSAFYGARGAWAYPPGADYLDRAMASVKELSVLGVVERYDESLVAAEHFLRVYFPELDCCYVPQNARDDRTDGLGPRLEQMRAACGAELYEFLLARNEGDLALWECAKQELDRRLSYIPALEDKLSWFRVRCQRLGRP